MRQQQNVEQCKSSKAEHWMSDKLKTTNLRWTRQAQSGVRLFDFWNHQLGVAVEVDGPEHDTARDAARDYAVLKTRAVIVLRVRNFSEADASLALSAIAVADTWNARRKDLGMTVVRNAEFINGDPR